MCPLDRRPDGDERGGEERARTPRPSVTSTSATARREVARRSFRRGRRRRGRARRRRRRRRRRSRSRSSRPRRRSSTDARARGTKAKRRRFAREDGARGGEDARGEFVGGDVDVARRRARDSARAAARKEKSERWIGLRDAVRRPTRSPCLLASRARSRSPRASSRWIPSTRPRARDRERRRSRPPPRTPLDTPRAARAPLGSKNRARARAFAHRSRPYTRTSSPRNPSRSSASPATRAAPLQASRCRAADEIRRNTPPLSSAPSSHTLSHPPSRSSRSPPRLPALRAHRSTPWGLERAPAVANASREIGVSSHDKFQDEPSRRACVARSPRSTRARARTSGTISPRRVDRVARPRRRARRVRRARARVRRSGRCATTPPHTSPRAAFAARSAPPRPSRDGGRSTSSTPCPSARAVSLDVRDVESSHRYLGGRARAHRDVLRVARRSRGDGDARGGGTLARARATPELVVAAAVYLACKLEESIVRLADVVHAPAATRARWERRAWSKRDTTASSSTIGRTFGVMMNR